VLCNKIEIKIKLKRLSHKDRINKILIIFSNQDWIGTSRIQIGIQLQERDLEGKRSLT
jgi:hypothetical protein